MTAFYELHPPCSSDQERTWLLPSLSFLKCSPPASLKLARANKPSHNTGTNASVLLPVLALWLIHLHNVQTHVGGVAVVS